MTIPFIRVFDCTPATAYDQRPIVLVGSSLGLPVEQLWRSVVGELSSEYRFVGWDLPGHGKTPDAEDAFKMDELASGVADALEVWMIDQAEAGLDPKIPMYYLGVSMSGLVGLALLTSRPNIFQAAVLAGTSARVGTEDSWLERIGVVETQGTQSVIDGARQRWFTPTFTQEHAKTVEPLFNALVSTSATGYVLCCKALTYADLSENLDQLTVPVLLITGTNDETTTLDEAFLIAEQAQQVKVLPVEGAAHLVPFSHPDVLSEHIQMQFRV